MIWLEVNNTDREFTIRDMNLEPLKYVHKKYESLKINEHERCIEIKIDSTRILNLPLDRVIIEFFNTKEK
jgi:hypothetical protein